MWCFVFWCFVLFFCGEILIFFIFGIGEELFVVLKILLGFVLIWILFCNNIIGVELFEYFIFFVDFCNLLILILCVSWFIVVWSRGGLLLLFTKFELELFFFLLVFFELLWMLIMVGCFLLIVGLELFVE